MLDFRFIVLFALVVFGAYSVQQAKVDVKKIKQRASRIRQYRESLTPRDAEFMSKAMALRSVSHTDNHAQSVGSVIVKDGRIIGEGWDKTVLLNDPSAHAEVEAIRNACKHLGSQSLKGSTIYVSSQSCSMCHSLMQLAEVNRIVYCVQADTANTHSTSALFGSYDEIIPRQRSDSQIPQIPILEEEVRSLNMRYKSAN